MSNDLFVRYKKEENTNYLQEELVATDVVNRQEDLHKGSFVGRVLNLGSKTKPDYFSSRLSLILIFMSCKQSHRLTLHRSHSSFDLPDRRPLANRHQCDTIRF